MQKRILIKNPAQEIQLITRRSLVACVVMGILLLSLIFRLGYLQIYKHPLYTTLSKKNWLDLVPLEPTRGLVFDRNGILLAENISVFSLDLTPYQVNNISNTIAELKKIILLTDTDILQFQKQVKQHRRVDKIPLKLRLSEEEVARFSENQYRFPGLTIQARLMRYYPLGESFSHVLGYVGRINTQELNAIDPINYSASHYIGKIRIEKFYEEELHGTVGYEEIENDASGKQLRTLTHHDSIPGKHLYLSIDSRLQVFIAQLLQNERGAIIILNPNNGQVLAMVSSPSFDPNLFVSGMSTQTYQLLREAKDKPLYNRVLRGLYTIASTIKPFIALSGLQSKVFTPSDVIVDPGWFQLNHSAHIFHDWRRYGHGSVNLEKAIMSSCDTYFYHFATKLGMKRINDMLTQFGFGELTGIDLDDELSGNLASPEWKYRTKGAPLYDGDTVVSIIGHGYMQTTPLQLANATATLANRGKRWIPSLLLGEQIPSKSIEIGRA